MKKHLPRDLRKTNKRKIRWNDEKLAPFDQIEEKTKPEKLVGTKLWTKEHGSSANPLHELQILRFIHQKRRQSFPPQTLSYVSLLWD